MGRQWETVTYFLAVICAPVFAGIIPEPLRKSDYCLTKPPIERSSSSVGQWIP